MSANKDKKLLQDIYDKQILPERQDCSGFVKLGKKLGSGMYGSVYEGIYTYEGKDINVAVKIMPSKDVNTYIREIVLLEYLQTREEKCPVMGFFAGFKCKGLKTYTEYYIILEKVEGVDLFRMIRDIREEEKYPLPMFGKKDPAKSKTVRDLMTISLKLIEAVICIHKYEVYHFDIKPENIMVGGSPPKITLIDFGLGCQRTSEKSTFKQFMCDNKILKKTGTPMYMPAEDIVGQGYIDMATATYQGLAIAKDAYSLGCVLYEMWFGETVADENEVKTMTDLKFMFIDNTRPKYIRNLPAAHRIKSLGEKVAEVCKHLTEREANYRWTPTQALKTFKNLNSFYLESK